MKTENALVTIREKISLSILTLVSLPMTVTMGNSAASLGNTFIPPGIFIPQSDAVNKGHHRALKDGQLCPDVTTLRFQPMAEAAAGLLTKNTALPLKPPTFLATSRARFRTRHLYDFHISCHPLPYLEM